MTEIRFLTITPPAGEWIAVSLHEAAAPDGPWEPVQAAAVETQGPRPIRFRPRVEHGYYKTIWTADGGLIVAEGEIQRLHGASGASGSIARIGGKQ